MIINESVKATATTLAARRTKPGRRVRLIPKGCDRQRMTTQFPKQMATRKYATRIAAPATICAEPA
ncbi:hypothetical protein [Bradyrhizobium iriomotense]|nr:hypothetical protein [Bradyrhizobium iriomotense]